MLNVFSLVCGMRLRGMLKLSMEPFTSSEKKPDPKRNEKYLKTIKARLDVIWNIYSDF